MIGSRRRFRQERILIVDSDLAIIRFLSAVFTPRFRIETAINGAQALEKTEATYFDVIISDVDLPVMSGLEWYFSALKHDPTIGARMLFLSGDVAPEALKTIKDKKLSFLAKPATLIEITNRVSTLLREPRIMSTDLNKRR